MRKLLTAALFTALPLLAQSQQGVALFEQGRYAEARRLLAPLKNDPIALYTLGRIALQEGKAEEAEELIEKAVEKAPNNAEYHFWLGNAYGRHAMEAGMLKQMMLAPKIRDEFEAAVRLDPNSIDARFALIDFYVMAPGIMGGGTDKAMEQAAQIKKRDVYLGHRAYARIYSRQKKQDMVRKEYEQAIKDQPNSAAAHTSLGSVIGMNEKKYKEGFDELEIALKLDPNYSVAQFRFGQLAATSATNMPRGEELLKRYLTYKPKESEPDIASAHYYLGMLYEKQGKKTEAKASYAVAVRMAPTSKTFQEALKRVS